MIMTNSKIPIKLQNRRYKNTLWINVFIIMVSTCKTPPHSQLVALYQAGLRGAISGFKGEFN